MQKDIILVAENLSKQYRLGLIGTGTLSHDLNRWWHRIRGKQDPYLKVGDVNDRSTRANSEYVWALREINFEVKKGEVLGIIGKNGAGKSTLLKILSRVTSPTTGVIKTKGRIASLLEVGTGFHGEMTGRENIYLNGAILGMTKKEINAKLDEIIDFSGCERYIDTPVKRYSSGMTVRLAFAVAAFLEPDILIIDEVLAVGDAEFQKKAVGKMKDISKADGRTVLFVSHNMTAIQSLCDRVVLMENGRITNGNGGEPNAVIETYLKSNKKDIEYKVKPDYLNVKIEQKNTYDFKEPLSIKLIIDSTKEIEDEVFIDFAVVNAFDEFVLHYRMNFANETLNINKGKNIIDFKIDNPSLVLGEYSFIFYMFNKMQNVIFWAENCAHFQIYNASNVPIAEGHVKSHVLPYVKIIQS
ncbi:MAG: ABC transporter ATP-binding protein [Winogradskyella sp.]|nr:ABC transporter ATP-binding protein [Winogradskyella sp.]